MPNFHLVRYMQLRIQLCLQYYCSNNSVPTKQTRALMLQALAS